MRDYDIKRGHFRNIDGNLDKIVSEIFGGFDTSDGRISTSYGALVRLELWLEGKTKLWVDTDLDTTMDDEVAMNTQRRYNELLFRLTGYTSKQRAKRLKDKAKKGKL